MFHFRSITTFQADIRAGLNSFLAGFVGVWHYVNVTDFEYSYKIYTPIKGFEENGVVLKLIFKEGLDSEVSVKLGGHKVCISYRVILISPAITTKVIKHVRTEVRW